MKIKILLCNSVVICKNHLFMLGSLTSLPLVINLRTKCRYYDNCRTAKILRWQFLRWFKHKKYRLDGSMKITYVHLYKKTCMLPWVYLGNSRALVASELHSRDPEWWSSPPGRIRHPPTENRNIIIYFI